MAQGKPSKSKMRRSSADKAYYARYRERYAGKQLRAKRRRARQIDAAQDHPEIGSPSQVRTRLRLLRKRRIQDVPIAEEASSVLETMTTTSGLL